MSKETFDFSEALRRMKEGKRVKRKDCIGTYLASNGKILHGPLGVPLSKLDYRMSPFDADDILATDWEEVEE